MRPGLAASTSLRRLAIPASVALLAAGIGAPIAAAGPSERAPAAPARSDAAAAGAPSGAAPTPTERALYRDGPDGRYLLDRGWSTLADRDNVGLRDHWEDHECAPAFRVRLAGLVPAEAERRVSASAEIAEPELWSPTTPPSTACG